MFSKAAAPFHSEEFIKYAVKKASGQTCKLVLLREVRRLTRLFYDGRLGAFYSKERTLFKVWAPTASTAAIKLESPDLLQTNTFQMMRREKGVFEVTVEGDLNGWSYLYKLYVNGTPLLTVDPYAKAVTVNGEKGVVIDPEEVKVKNTVRQAFTVRVMRLYMRFTSAIFRFMKTAVCAIKANILLLQRTELKRPAASQRELPI